MRIPPLPLPRRALLARSLGAVGVGVVKQAPDTHQESARGHGPRSVEARGLSGGAPPADQTEGFSLLGVHSHAAAQPTADGRVLAALEPWRGRLYIGYGDYGANTGPIHVVAFDPGRGAFTDSLLTVNSEAIYNFRALGEHLYAPAIDPKREGSYAFAAAGPDGVWRDVPAPGVDARHAFDVATLAGDDLWVVGSSGAEAVAWRSLDGGSTWTETLVEPPESHMPGDFARFYFAGTLNRELYVQAHDYSGGPHVHSRVFNGEEWRAGPDLLGPRRAIGWRPIAFAGYLVYASWPKLLEGHLMLFDGRSSVDTGRALYDLAAGDGALWILDPKGAIWRTTDPRSWRVVSDAPPGSRSLAILDGYLFIGTSASELYRSRRPIATGAGC